MNKKQKFALSPFELIVIKNLVDSRISRVMFELDQEIIPGNYLKYLRKSLKELDSISRKLYFLINY